MSKQQIPRIIPVLLLDKKGLYKTVKFKNPKYVGDPLNAVKIFNDKEVDELIFLDINASAERRGPDFNYLSEIASECFMPLCYGGGITKLDHIRKLINLGIEKVSINTAALEDSEFIKKAVAEFGSSTIVISMDVKKNLLGKFQVYSKNIRNIPISDPVQFAIEINKASAGELLINSVDKDGTYSGYDLKLIKRITDAVDIPLIACGGAAVIRDFKNVITESGASAAAAGSMFVFHGTHRAVLISYPSQQELQNLFLSND